jgi:hypothetical protein
VVAAAEIAAREAAEMATAMIAAVMTAAVMTAVMDRTSLWLPGPRVDAPPGVGCSLPGRHSSSADVDRHE